MLQSLSSCSHRLRSEYIALRPVGETLRSGGAPASADGEGLALFTRRGIFEAGRPAQTYSTPIFGERIKRMKTKDINTVIEQFDALPLEEKELAAGIIRKAYAEAARDELAKRVKTAVRNQKAGTVRKGGVADLLKDLEP